MKRAGQPTYGQIAAVVEKRHGKRYTPAGIREVCDRAMRKIGAELRARMEAKEAKSDA